MTRRVLIAVTSHDRMGYTAEQTGLNLEEFACAYHRFTENNFKVTAASPAGGAVPIDPGSVKLRALGADGRRFIAGSDTILDNAEKLADIDPDDFSALFYPGATAPCGISPPTTETPGSLRPSLKGKSLLGLSATAPPLYSKPGKATAIPPSTAENSPLFPTPKSRKQATTASPPFSLKKGSKSWELFSVPESAGSPTSSSTAI